MLVVGTGKLDEFCKKRHDPQQALKAWLAEARAAMWETPADIKSRYRSASFIGRNRVVFNIRGNKYRLIAVVNYAAQVVLIRFVGTHDEYDRFDAEAI